MSWGGNKKKSAAWRATLISTHSWKRPYQAAYIKNLLVFPLILLWHVKLTRKTFNGVIIWWSFTWNIAANE